MDCQALVLWRFGPIVASQPGEPHAWSVELLQVGCPDHPDFRATLARVTLMVALPGGLGVRASLVLSGWFNPTKGT